MWRCILVVGCLGGVAFGEPAVAPAQETIRSYNGNATLLFGWLPTADRFAFGLRLGFGLRVSARVEVGVGADVFATNRQRTIGRAIEHGSLALDAPTITETAELGGDTGSDDDSPFEGQAEDKGHSSNNSVQSLPELAVTPRLCARYYLASLTDTVVPYFELSGGAMFSHEGTAALASGTLGYLLWRGSALATYVEVSYRWLYGLAAKIWGEEGSHHELHLGLGISLSG